MLTGADSRKAWSDKDRLLMSAYQAIENERCGQCGLPMYICQNESEKVVIRLEEQSCAVIAKKAQHGGRGKKKELPEGTVLVARPYHADGKDIDLSTMRTPFYESIAKKREEIDASLWPSQA